MSSATPQLDEFLRGFFPTLVDPSSGFVPLARLLSHWPNVLGPNLGAQIRAVTPHLLRHEAETKQTMQTYLRDRTLWSRYSVNLAIVDLLLMDDQRYLTEAAAKKLERMLMSYGATDLEQFAFVCRQILSKAMLDVAQRHAGKA